MQAGLEHRGEQEKWCSAKRGGTLRLQGHDQARQFALASSPRLDLKVQ